MKRLIELFYETGSYLEGDFVLSSGARSSYYVDCKRLMMHAEAMNLICEGMEKYLREFPENAIGGVVVGPDPVIGALVGRSVAYRSLTGFLVRKQAKEHGSAKLIEGALEPEDLACLIEDVTTTGQSLLYGVELLRKFGANVEAAITILDRKEGAERLLKQNGVQLYSLLTIDDLKRK